jgi:hypothetical protein
MATPIKRIEKEFLFKVLYDEQIPILYLRDRAEYILTLQRPTKTDIVFRPNKPINKLKPKTKMELMFDYRGQGVTFSVQIGSIKDDLIICDVPDALFKNLDRSFSRIGDPPDLEVQFTFLGDRYNLSFPKVSEFEPGEQGEYIGNADPRNLSGLIKQMSDWLNNYASGYKLVIFKGTKPSSTEELIVAETGKTLFLPSTLNSLPQDDPHPRKRIITEEMFKRYLETTGVDLAFVDSALARFLKDKHNSGILSDAWIPILFQQYVTGYIHIWIDKENISPFDYNIIDTMYQFTKVIAYSLKINGYFEAGKLKNEPFEGKVIDISASGVLFAYPHSSLSSSLLPESELTVKIITPRRSVNAGVKIIRRFKDSSMGYFGCRFIDMAPEDLRFLFEFIYGKVFTDTDASFLSGQV